jgi:hypothetical protein
MLKTFIIPVIKSYAPNTLRHGAQAAAGYLVASGFASASEGELIGGAVLTLFTFAWSVIEKKGLLNKLFA